MLELANDRRRFGSPRLHELLRREELVQNHKRTERIYQEENLSLRTRKRVKRPSHARIVQAGPAGPDEQWAMDFVSDSLGRATHPDFDNCRSVGSFNPRARSGYVVAWSTSCARP